MTKANTLAYYGMATITAVKSYGTCLVTKLYNFVTETRGKKASAWLLSDIYESSRITSTCEGRLRPYSQILDLTEKVTLVLMKHQR
jgi:hypothetical protein